MKVAIVFFALVAVALAAKQCHDKSDCTCDDADQVANCENHVCTCVSTGQGKRQSHPGEECSTVDDCSYLTCEHGGMPKCEMHHGNTGHCHCAH